MRKIKLIDSCFAHCAYSNNPLPPIQFSDEIEWDREKPDGQFRKDASSDKFLNDFPDFKFTSLFEGIQKTYNIKYNERLEAKRF